MKEEEIYQAVMLVKKKGIAWDLMTYWIPRLMVDYKPTQITKLFRMIKKMNKSRMDQPDLELHI